MRNIDEHALVFGRTSNEGWPTSSEVGNTNSTSEFAMPTAKAMGHPTPQITCDGALRRSFIIPNAMRKVEARV